MATNETTKPVRPPSEIATEGSLQLGSLEAVTMPRHVSRAIRATLLRGLSADPSARFESMEAALRALEPHRPVLRHVGFLAIAAGAVAATWATSIRGDVPLCEPARSPMHEVWHDEAAATLFEVAEPAAAQALRDRIEDYGARWQAQWLEACRARHVDYAESPELFDQRTLCLDRGRASVAAVLDAAQSSDAVRNAALVVSDLPGPE